MADKETKGTIDATIINNNVDAKSSDDVNIPITTKAIDVFNSCIKRAENLIAIHSVSKSKKITDDHYCDCYRAAVVLSISALDAYIRKIVIGEILNIISGEQNIPEKLQKYLTEKLDKDKLLEAARKADLRGLVEQVVIDDFDKKSFQGEWKITTYMELIGHQNIFNEICKKTDKNEANFRLSIEQYTQRRHIIAHRGDFDFNQSPPIEKAIDKHYAEKCVKDIKFFVETVNKIIER